MRMCCFEVLCKTNLKTANVYCEICGISLQEKSSSLKIFATLLVIQFWGIFIFKSLKLLCSSNFLLIVCMKPSLKWPIASLCKCLFSHLGFNEYYTTSTLSQTAQVPEWRFITHKNLMHIWAVVYAVANMALLSPLLITLNWNITNV